MVPSKVELMYPGPASACSEYVYLDSPVGAAESRYKSFDW